MRKGELQQVAPPQELYDKPVNVFVAGFIGSPAMNMLEARIERRNGGVAAVLGEAVLPLDDGTRLAAYEGRPVVLGIRPENLSDPALMNDDSQPRLRAHVELREALGSEVLVHFTTSARPAVTDETRELAEDVGQDRVASADHPALLVGRFSPHTRAVEGDDIDGMIDRRALHFFDPQTGLAIAGA
jgi:multiple sugar transport system ATP-binding protein